MINIKHDGLITEVNPEIETPEDLIVTLANAPKGSIGYALLDKAINKLFGKGGKYYKGPSEVNP